MLFGQVYLESPYRVFCSSLLRRLIDLTLDQTKRGQRPKWREQPLQHSRGWGLPYSSELLWNACGIGVSIPSWSAKPSRIGAINGYLMG